MLKPQQALLLPRIYDAAAAEDQWAHALDAAAEATQAKSSALIAIDNVGYPFAIASGSTLLKPSDLKYYQENLFQYELAAWEYLQDKPAHTIVFDQEIWPDEPGLEERPDNSWLRSKYGVWRRVAIKLNNSPAWMDSLTFQYSDAIKSIPPEMRELVAPIVPHVAKVVELHRTFMILRNHYHAVLTALDRVKIGVCLTSHHGDVILGNREAQRIFDLADGITLGKDKRIYCTESELTGALKRAITNAILTVEGRGDTPETLIAAGRRSGTHPFLVEVAPLSDSAHELERHLRGAIIFIVDPGNPRPFSVANVARCFSLTSAEALVCELMVEGLTDAEIAHRRSVSPDTVRTQVKAIYAKTGTRRRAELIRLALSITPPIEIPRDAS